MYTGIVHPSHPHRYKQRGARGEELLNTGKGKHKIVKGHVRRKKRKGTVHV